MGFLADSALVDEVRPSPNWRERKNGENVRVVVIHATWMASDSAALERLCDPKTEVSCHYYIDREGRIIQLVPEEKAAFHAGKSQWILEDGVQIDGVNNWSIGIEIGNAGPFAAPPGAEEEKKSADWGNAEPFRGAQYAALEALLADLLRRYPALSARDVVGHDRVSPGRKSDPGPHFDWEWLRRAGLCR